MDVEPEDDELGAPAERTMRIDLSKVKPRARPSGEATSPVMPAHRPWKRFSFTKLEKVTKLHAQLLRRIDWLLPNVHSPGEIAAGIETRLREMIDTTVTITSDTAHIVTPTRARRFVADPTFLAVLAPQPNKTRGLLEVELVLAHAIIDMLLGGAGEAVAIRPLTDIEEGVLTYVIIEALKVLAPAIDTTLPTLRLENVVKNLDEALAMMNEDEHLAVVQLKAIIGTTIGFVRVFIPESILSSAQPPSDSLAVRTRRALNAVAHSARLSQVKVWLRAEIGRVDINASELGQVREGDVILVDALSARPDLGAVGTAELRVGTGRHSVLDVEVAVDNNRYLARVTGVRPHGQLPVREPEEVPPQAAEGEAALEAPPPMQIRSNPVDNPEGAELLNDIPLQLAVELGRVSMTAEELVAMKVGNVVDLNRSVGEPLDLSVHGKIVARGELVEIDGNLGVRIVSLAG